MKKELTGEQSQKHLKLYKFLGISAIVSSLLTSCAWQNQATIITAQGEVQIPLGQPWGLLLGQNGSFKLPKTGKDFTTFTVRPNDQVEVNGSVIIVSDKLFRVEDEKQTCNIVTNVDGDPQTPVFFQITCDEPTPPPTPTRKPTPTPEPTKTPIGLKGTGKHAAINSRFDIRGSKPVGGTIYRRS